MSLATRCTQCGTIFKVVQDQLKVSEGWVRCGRCHEVFNALEGLFDLERDPPPARRQPARPPVPAPSPVGNPAEPGFTREPAIERGAVVVGTPNPPPAWEPTAPVGLGSAPEVLPAASPSSAPSSLDDVPAFLLKPRAASAAPAEAPPAPAAPMQPAAMAAPATPAPAARHPLAPPLAEVPSTHEDDALDSRWLMSPTRDGRAASERLNREAHTDDFADAQFPQDVGEDLSEAEWAEAAQAVDAPSPTAADALAVTRTSGRTSDTAKRSPGSKKGGKRKLPADAPDFVKRAERRAQWKHPAVRATLGGVALVLVALLAGQAAFRFKDMMAARWPETAPALHALCEAAGCEIEPPRQLDEALLVDSVSLSRPQGVAGSAASGEVYRLNVVLRNRAPYAVAAPHLEVVLKDAGDALVTRKVMALSEFGYGAPALPAGQSAELQLLFSSASQITSYVVEVFYP